MEKVVGAHGGENGFSYYAVVLLTAADRQTPEQISELIAGDSA